VDKPGNSALVDRLVSAELPGLSTGPSRWS